MRQQFEEVPSNGVVPASFEDLASPWQPDVPAESIAPGQVEPLQRVPTSAPSAGIPKLALPKAGKLDWKPEIESEPVPLPKP